MKITVKLDIGDIGKDFEEMRDEFETVASEELHRFNEENVRMLQRDIRANAYGLPPKRRKDGKPPLIDSGKYVDSFVVETTGLVSGVSSEGMNDHMSNEALGELLEYGAGNIPARPHLRPWSSKVERKLPKLGDRIAERLVAGGVSRRR